MNSLMYIEHYIDLHNYISDKFIQLDNKLIYESWINTAFDKAKEIGSKTIKGIGNFLKNIYRFIVKMFHYLTRWFTVNGCKKLQNTIKGKMEKFRKSAENDFRKTEEDPNTIKVGHIPRNPNLTEKTFIISFIDKYLNILKKKYKFYDFDDDELKELIKNIYYISLDHEEANAFLISLLDTEKLNEFEDFFNNIKNLSENLIIIMLGINTSAKIVEDLAAANDPGYLLFSTFVNNFDVHMVSRIVVLNKILHDINGAINNKLKLKYDLIETFVTPIKKVLKPFIKSDAMEWYKDNKFSGTILEKFFELCSNHNEIMGKFSKQDKQDFEKFCSGVGEFYRNIQIYNKIFYYYPNFLKMFDNILDLMIDYIDNHYKIPLSKSLPLHSNEKQESVNINFNESGGTFESILIDNFKNLFMFLKNKNPLMILGLLSSGFKYVTYASLPITVSFTLVKWLFTRNNLDNEIKKTYKYLYQLKSKKIKLSDSQIKLIIHNEDYKDLKLTAESIKIIVRDINEMLEKDNTSASNPVFNLLGLPKSSYRYRATFMVHCFYINLLIFAINYKKIPINVRLNLLISLINYMDRLGTIKEPNPLNKLAILVNSSMSKLMGSLYKYIHPIIDYIAKNKTNLDEETVKANLEELDKYENKPKKLVTLLKGKSLKDRLKDGLKLMNEYFGLFANLKSFLALIKDILQLSSAIDNHHAGRYANKDRSDEDQELIDDNDYEEDD